ncbi:MAG: thioredoxin family protein, partial [Deltaproteobacteria bacterium]|nr:thioredoxin family protein [Deltaproteobacteria bacterium]
FITFILTLIILILIFSPAQAGWFNNYEAAKEQAVKEHKDMLLVFSGSDWCHWCQKLQEEVFSQEKFTWEAEKNFILVEIDFPQKKEIADTIKEQNQNLAKKYAVQGFPTVILANADGKPYAKTGYQQGGAEAYLTQLKNFRDNKNKRDKLLVEAKKTTGLERAKLLDQALATMMENHLLGERNKLIDEIIKLDPENKAGLRAKYELQHKVAPIEKALRKTGNFDQALTDLDKVLKAETNLQPEDRQRLYLFKASICLKGKKDKESGISNLEQAAKAAPNTKIAKQIPDIIASIMGERK